MATESVNQAPGGAAPFADRFEKGPEAALNYVEAALEAHRKSFGGSAEETRKMQWAVTGLLERAVQVLYADAYGEA